MPYPSNPQYDQPGYPPPADLPTTQFPSQPSYPGQQNPYAPPLNPTQQLPQVPDYGQPGYGQPGYGPGYGAAGYGPPGYAPPGGSGTPYGQAPRRNTLPWIIGGAAVVALLIVGGVLLFTGGDSKKSPIGSPSLPSGSALPSGATLPSGSASVPSSGFPNGSSAATATGLTCDRISQVPMLSQFLPQLTSTTATPPAGVPAPTTAPSASCAGTFADDSGDPALVYSFVGLTPDDYELQLTAAGWTQSQAGDADDPAIYDQDGSDYEVDVLTSGSNLIVVVDDTSGSSAGTDAPGPTDTSAAASVPSLTSCADLTREAGGKTTFRSSSAPFPSYLPEPEFSDGIRFECAATESGTDVVQVVYNGVQDTEESGYISQLEADGFTKTKTLSDGNQRYQDDDQNTVVVTSPDETGLFSVVWIQ